MSPSDRFAAFIGRRPCVGSGAVAGGGGERLRRRPARRRHRQRHRQPPAAAARRGAGAQGLPARRRRRSTPTSARRTVGSRPRSTTSASRPASPTACSAPNSRAAIGQYQAYLGYPPTGVLTEYERAFLTSSYDRAIVGGPQAAQMIASSGQGTRGLLLAFRQEQAGVPPRRRGRAAAGGARRSVRGAAAGRERRPRPPSRPRRSPGRAGGRGRRAGCRASSPGRGGGLDRQLLQPHQPGDQHQRRLRHARRDERPAARRSASSSAWRAPMPIEQGDSLAGTVAGLLDGRDGGAVRGLRADA